MTVLHIHDELKIAGEADARWRVSDPVVRDGLIKLFDRQARADVFEEFEAIKTKIAADEIMVVRAGAPRVSVATQADPKLFDRIQEVQQGLSFVESVQAKYGVSFSTAYEECVGTRRSPALCAFALPSKATMYRYRAQIRSGQPVLRGDKNKGNRKPRYSPEVVSLVESCAEQFYLVPGSTWNISDLTDHINVEAHAMSLITDDRTISAEYVRKIIFERKCVDADAMRLDPKDRAAARSTGGERIEVAAFLDRVEQDSVHLPFKVNVNGQPTDNCYLVHAIDAATGLVVGWTLVVGNPDESAGLRCIESILFSKQAAFKRLGLEGQIALDVFGTPAVIVLDNGPEGRGERMARLSALGITLLYCKSRHPHRKPFIERLNRAVKRALQRLAGSTRHNDKDGNRDPVAAGEILMTLDELERWIVRWYYEKWAKHELERLVRANCVEPIKLGRTPEQRWINSNKHGYPARPSPSLAQWQMTRFEHQERKLNRKTGVALNGFQYVGPHLQRLVDRFGERTVQCWVDPDDFRQIFVYTAEGEPLVPLIEKHTRPETPAFSFAEMQRRRAEHEPQPSTDPVSKRFDEDMRLAAVNAAKAAPRTSRKARNQLATRTVREAEAVDRASKNPLRPDRKDFTMNTSQGLLFKLGDLPDVRVVDRNTGKSAL